MFESADFWSARPRGLADLLATRARQLRRGGRPRALDRSRFPGCAGRRLSRMSVIARRQSRVSANWRGSRRRTPSAFYRAVRSIDWTAHLGPEATLACEFSGHHPAMTHTHFGALKLKDAIVDSAASRYGKPTRCRARTAWHQGACARTRQQHHAVTGSVRRRACIGVAIGRGAARRR